jgi:hypothetical protein
LIATVNVPLLLEEIAGNRTSPLELVETFPSETLLPFTTIETLKLLDFGSDLTSGVTAFPVATVVTGALLADEPGL